MVGMTRGTQRACQDSPDFFLGLKRGARQEARRVTWILYHTSLLSPACVWCQGRALFFGSTLLSFILSPAGFVG